MARIRTIKPEFWQDERVAALSPLARLLFVGLWNLADDEGRLRGHPALIRGALFPYDDPRSLDVGALLDELVEAGRVQAYEADGERFLWVRHFRQHQKIDRPTPSRLPAPPAETGSRPRAASTSPRRVLDESSRGLAQEGNGTGKGREGNRDLLTSASADAAEEAEEVVRRLWNDLAPPSLPRCRAMTRDRKAAARARLREHGLAEVRAAIERLGASGFCQGGGRQGWRADVDWLLRPGSIARVLEGKYDDGRGTPPEVAELPPPEPVGTAEALEAWGRMRKEAGVKQLEYGLQQLGALALSLDGRVLRVGVGDAYARAWAAEHYGEAFTRLARQATVADEVQFHIAGEQGAA